MGDGGGLYLWVKPTGGKLWRWSYRFDGMEKLMSLGKYPDVHLALAREGHALALARCAGKDRHDDYRIICHVARIERQRTLLRAPGVALFLARQDRPRSGRRLLPAQRDEPRRGRALARAKSELR